MKKELRDEIKQDELASGLEKAVAWVAAHRDEVRIGAGVLVVLLAAAGPSATSRAQRAQEADRAFRDALTTFEAPVASEIPPGADRPSGQVFATAEEKYKTAAAAFEGVERRFGSSTHGPAREVLRGAVAASSSGSTRRRRRRCKEVQSRGAGLEPELARVALANLYRRSGQVDKAVEATAGSPRTRRRTCRATSRCVSAAQTLEDAKRWAEARAAYRQLVRGVPGERLRVARRARAPSTCRPRSEC